MFITNNFEGDMKMEMIYFNYEGQTVTDFNTLEFSEDQNLNHI